MISENDMAALLEQFSDNFNFHVLPSYLSEPAIAALRTLPVAERREIASKIVGYAAESHNRGLVIWRMADRKNAPQWLQHAWKQIANEYPEPVLTITTRNDEARGGD